MEEELTSLYDDKELETKIKEAESKIREDLSRELLQNSLKLSKEEKKKKKWLWNFSRLNCAINICIRINNIPIFS